MNQEAIQTFFIVSSAATICKSRNGLPLGPSFLVKNLTGKIRNLRNTETHLGLPLWKTCDEKKLYLHGNRQ